jgi:hypothetical protein
MWLGVGSDLGLCVSMEELSMFFAKFGAVFVGAFSDFEDLVYRIPAPILASFCEKWSTPHQ